MKRSAFATLLIATLLSSCNGYREVSHIKEGWNSDVVHVSYRHKYGVEVSKRDWETRGCDGQVICSMKNGAIVTKSYTAAVLDGETTYTFPHSKIVEKTEVYKRGRLLKEITHYTSGLPQKETEYLASGAEVSTVWYESGSPMSVEEKQAGRLIAGRYYRIDESLDGQVLDGKGERRVRDSYGQLSSLDCIQGGVLLSRTTFHPTGTPKEVIPYEKGVVQGKKHTFLPGGEPKTIEEWSEGNQHGVTVVFRNGEKYAEIPYEHGRRKGVERRYREGERLEEEITWVADERHGPTRVFIGDKVKTDWYYQGKLVSRVVFEQMSHA